jgi:ent-copalyl diphosphate synthase
MVKDIDDTVMGFRLLRQHGYHVSTEALKHFETKDGEFVVYRGQTNQSVSAMYNLYRAADQAAFPGDDGVVRRAKAYSYAFLQERRASGDLNDKWIISSGLPSEVAYGLDFPWKANLPRVETRMYLEQYGGSDNVWIGKVLHRYSYFQA